MKLKIPKRVPFGRLNELRSLPEAERIAYSIPLGIFDDYRIKVFASRKALEAFCKAGSSMHALCKTPVHPTMLVNRNTQYPSK